MTVSIPEAGFRRADRRSARRARAQIAPHQHLRRRMESVRIAIGSLFHLIRILVGHKC